MKSYNGLYEQMIDCDEIKLAIKEAAKGRTKYKKVQNYLERIDEHAEELRNLIESGKWYPPHHDIVLLREGAHKKERTIQKPRWDNEQIMHHILMRQFKPLVVPRINRFCCGSIEGRSTHFLLHTMKIWVKRYKRRRFYVAELDIRKFYDNVNTDLLKTKLRKRIRDKRYLEILFKVIDASAPGLPKGFYTSPFLAHFYLEGLDNYILQQLKPDHYARFVDNMWLFSRNKRKLHKMVEMVERYLSQQLQLHLKNNWQIYRFDDGDGHGRSIDLLGFVVHRYCIGLRKGILKRLRGKVWRMRKKHRCTWRDASSVLSRMGFIRWSDTYGWYRKWIKPYLSLRYCKQRISTHQRRLNYERLANSSRQPGRAPGRTRQAQQSYYGVST